MENKVYTVSVEELSQHIKGLNIPHGAIIEFSYRLKSPVKLQATEKKKRNLPSNVLRLKKNLRKIGNISEEGQKIFDKERKLFRETFDI